MRTLEPGQALVEFLDRVLERGVLIHADLIISLAGVPLVGLQLRATLAGIETMAHYGLMDRWTGGPEESAEERGFPELAPQAAPRGG